MATLTRMVALLAVALLVAHAYAAMGGRQQRCSQMSAREELRSCAQYMRQQARDVLQMRGIDNPQRREGGGSFDECCSELRVVDEPCRCGLLEEIVMEEQTRGQEESQMLQIARNLPSMCGMRPQQCDF